MDNQDEKYLSYMLRLWQAMSEAGSSWRASLEDPRTGERQGFADLQGLFGFLTTRTDESTGRPQAEGNHQAPPGDRR